ncbi:MAG: class I SAM-dependent methyltransferase [Bacteroidales bacterium]|nr:class I SAM-dependent methyltransferase [Bacteroidales bacterium]
MGLLGKIFSNTRKPEGLFGKMMVSGMNGGSHATLAKWALDKCPVPQEGEIVDIGCGGGANLARVMERSRAARVTGIDYSPVSVAKSRKVNADAIKTGRCAVLEGNVAALPFRDGQFNLATAFETIYFWPDIENSFAEVRRVLTEGGMLLIVNEDDGLTDNNEKWEKLIDGMHTYTPDEIRLHLKNAGFKDITVYREEARRWLAVTAIK